MLLVKQELLTLPEHMSCLSLPFFDLPILITNLVSSNSSDLIFRICYMNTISSFKESRWPQLLSRHDITEILLKVALKHPKSLNQSTII